MENTYRISYIHAASYTLNVCISYITSQVPLHGTINGIMLVGNNVAYSAGHSPTRCMYVPLFISTFWGPIPLYLLHTYIHTFCRLSDRTTLSDMTGSRTGAHIALLFVDTNT